jgi:hypothetical protein
MKKLDARLLALEEKCQVSAKPKLSVLVMAGDDAERELAAWRAQGYEAVIEGVNDPLNEAFLG